MDYNLKIKIGDIELFESQDLETSQPFITNVTLKNSTSLSAMEIGATACDCLYFTLMNPYKESFDGEKVEFFISAQSDTSEIELSEIEEAVGDEAVFDVIDENELDDIEDDEGEEGEDLTPEEEADVEETAAEDIASEYEFFEGEDDINTDITTGEEVEAEWISMGVYYVFTQRNSSKDNSIRFECLDGFSKLNGIFKPTIQRTTIQNLYNDYRIQMRSQFGIEVDEFEFDSVYNVSVNWDLDCTYRDAIGYFAGLVGGYATFGYDDTLGISFYSFSDNILLDTALLKYNETSAGEMYVQGVQCDRSINPYRDDVIEVGVGQSINFFNPFVTEEMLEDIYQFYKGAKYVGAELSIIWNHEIQCGQFVRIMSTDEYTNYLGLNNALETTTDNETILDLKDKMNSLGRVVLVSNQTIDFTADATSVITSICETAYSKENKVKSPSDAVFRRLYAEMIAAEYIDATKVVTKGLQAGTAEIKQAIVDDLEVNSINGNVIKNSAVLAKALSNEMVETVLGVKVFYAAEEPTAVNVGDIWYVTVADQDYNPLTDVIKVWNGEEWIEEHFSTPDSIFMANSIVAQDINAESVTTSNAFMDLLQARIAYIGSKNSRHVRINADGLHVFISGDVDGENEIAHLGYGQTVKAPSAGQLGVMEDAPYYSLGKRVDGSQIGAYSYAEGVALIASGHCSHAEGVGTIASEPYTHAEGRDTKASGYGSHAEGESTIASATYSHAEGFNTTASGGRSHAEGESTIASGGYSHAQNEGTVADGPSMTAIGKYNTENSGKAFVIGNGSEETRSNALEVGWNGKVTLEGHAEEVGTKYEYAGSQVSMSANTAKTLYSRTLTEGRYIIFGNAYFNNASSGGYLETHLEVGGVTQYIARDRRYAQANYDACCEVSAPIVITGTQTVSIVATSSVARNATGRIYAMRIT